MREHFGRIRASIAGMRGATGANLKDNMPPMRSACSGEIKSRAIRSRSDQRYAAFTSRVGGWRCQRCHSGGPDHQGPVVVLGIKGENFAVTKGSDAKSLRSFLSSMNSYGWAAWRRS